MATFTIDNTPEPIVFEDGTAAEQTIRNCKNLLMCMMGEVPYDRLRGFDPALFDLPLERFRERLLPELDRVMAWECDAEVLAADCETGNDGRIRITVTIEIEDE